MQGLALISRLIVAFTGGGGVSFVTTLPLASGDIGGSRNFGFAFAGFDFGIGLTIINFGFGLIAGLGLGFGLDLTLSFSSGFGFDRCVFQSELGTPVP